MMKKYMKSISVLSGDPGISNDPFGVVGQAGTYPEKKIYLRYAKQFIKQPYGIVAKHFGKIQNKIKPNIILLEKNFDYDNISKAFSRLPIQYITTSANLTEQTRQNGFAVDKPFMINWLKLKKKNHEILFTENPTKDMQVLIDQYPQIVPILSAGGYTYKAMRGRHDDLFMAHLIGANFIRLWWDKMDGLN